MDDDELERFVHSWLAKKRASYLASERFSGAGDKGRDVVAYLSASRMEGTWHNYQCKQLKKRLGEPDALLELGKIVAYSARGDFSLPSKYVFVAPRGVVRGVQELIAHPERFRRRLLESWPEHVEKGISETPTPLTDQIKRAIARFDFREIYALDAAKLLKDDHIKAVLVEWFGEDPGRAPAGAAPVDVTYEEAPYVGQLLRVYGEAGGAVYLDPAQILADPDHGDHFRDQRTRYFDAAAFERYYRDNTPSDYVDLFRTDMYHGVIDTYRDTHMSALARVNRVMAQAASTKPSGVLGEHSRVTVRQGYCHHFANEGVIDWAPAEAGSA
jgi:hypothetical protein